MFKVVLQFQKISIATEALFVVLFVFKCFLWQAESCAAALFLL
jgi:hypothetical protein